MKIVLADMKAEVVDAWRVAFDGYEDIAVHRGSIFGISCDALVSPANSFGYIGGGPANSCTVHLARPFGAALHATAMSLALARLSSFRGTGGDWR